MIDDLVTWWRSLTPETQVVVLDAGVVVGAFLVAQVLGFLVRAKLRARRFDDLLTVPWSRPPAREEQRLTPTGLAVGLLKLTVGAIAIRVLAEAHAYPHIAAAIDVILGRVWLLAAVVTVALYFARTVAQGVVEVLQSSVVEGRLQAWFPKPTARDAKPGVAPLIGGVVYGLAALLVLMVAADVFAWSQTATVVVAVWQLVLHLLSAVFALLIGWLGVTWVRSHEAPAADPAAPGGAEAYHTGLAIIAGTTLVAVALLSVSGGLVSLVLLIGLVLLLAPLREHVPDIWAGVVLKAQGVRSVPWEGSPTPLQRVGLLATELRRDGEALHRPNRQVLRAFLDARPPTTSSP